MNKLIKALVKKIIKFESFFVALIFFVLTCVYLFPMFQRLIILPLDLLISNYRPWYLPGTILLKNPYMQDSIVQLFPWRHLVFQSLTQGIIPFWNPYQFMGMPFMAAMKPMVFYPLNILFVFGETTSWNMLLFLQIFLSLIFFYLLVRDFKIPVIPSMLGSLAFSLSSLMIGFLEFGSDGHAILWIPLFLYFTKKYLDTGNVKNLFFLAISLTFSIFAGQLQFTGYGLILLGFFIFFYGFSIKADPKKYIFIISSLILGIGMSGVQLIPALELFGNSHRGVINTFNVFNQGLQNPVLLLRLISPDFFGSPVTRDATIGYIESAGYYGIIPFFFSLYAILTFRKNFLIKFFIAVFVICILFSFKYIGSIVFLLKIPLITSGSGGRIFMLVLFSGAVLSAFGLSNFISEKNDKLKFWSVTVFTFFVFLALGVKIALLHDNLLVKQFIHNVNVSFIILPVFLAASFIYVKFKNRFRYSGQLFLILVFLLTFIDLFRFGYRFLTFSNERFLYPEMGVTSFIKSHSDSNFNRVYGVTEPELSTYLNISSVETYNPLYLFRTANFLQSIQGKEIDKLSEDNKYFLTEGKQMKQALDFLGVSLIVDSIDSNPATKYFMSTKAEKELNKIYSDDRYSVYENKTAFPRFYLVYTEQTIKSDKTILKDIRENPLSFRSKVILEENIPLKLKPGTGSANLVFNNINYQKFTVKTDEPALFYVSDTYYPGWSAKINGAPTKIYRANYNFRAVLVPKGESIVEFNYVPNHFTQAVVISLVSFIVLVFALFIISKKTKEFSK